MAVPRVDDLITLASFFSLRLMSDAVPAAEATRMVEEAKADHPDWDWDALMPAQQWVLVAHSRGYDSGQDIGKPMIDAPPL